jgi:hypothetical protein
MPDSTRLQRRESGRAEVIRDERGSVVARQTVGEGGVTWIQFSPFDDTPYVESDEQRALAGAPRRA